MILLSASRAEQRDTDHREADDGDADQPGHDGAVAVAHPVDRAHDRPHDAPARPVMRPEQERAERR